MEASEYLSLLPFVLGYDVTSFNQWIPMARPTLIQSMYVIDVGFN